ncbi:MAG: folate family ECF transporter S component [Ruminiclostridium sp.]|nr:folate family ECF transporter S component [Ruminiclostridium sp.]
MAYIFNSFKKSAMELKSIRCIAVVGVFLAVAVVLDGFGSIRIGDFIKINFACLPLALIGILFGPTVGFFAGVLVDIIGYLINPIGAFLPWLMLITGLEGLVYGLVLYNLKPEKTRHQLIRIIIARAIVCVVCNLILNTWALYSYGFIVGDSIIALIGARVLTNVISFAASVPLMMAVLIPVKIAYNKMTSKTNRA